jgi:alpha-amylase
MNAYLDRRGGRLFELDYLPRNWNYLDTFQRRQEPFHDEATRAAGYDAWPRSAFVDHLLDPAQELSAFSRGSVSHLCDLSNLEYEIAALDKEHNTVTFRGVCQGRESLAEIAIYKVFRFGKNRIDLEYRVHNTGMEPLAAVFASEINLSFHSLEVGKLRLHVRQGRSKTEITPDSNEVSAISDLQFQDVHNGTVVTVNPSERPDLWCFPVEAVGILWDHPHWFYQSNCAVLRWPLQLETGGERSFSVSLRIDTAK